MGQRFIENYVTAPQTQDASRTQGLPEALHAEFTEKAMPARISAPETALLTAKHLEDVVKSSAGTMRDMPIGRPKIPPRPIKRGIPIGGLERDYTRRFQVCE